MTLADTIAAMHEPEGFLLDVMMSGDDEATKLLITALKELDAATCCFAVLDTIVEARRREDEDALQAALRLFEATRDR